MTKYLQFSMILLLIANVNSFHTSSYIHLSSRKLQLSRPSLSMTQSDENQDLVLNDIRNKLKNSEYYEAYQILKRNPIAHLSFEDGKQFLNNIDALVVPVDDYEKRQKQVRDVFQPCYSLTAPAYLIVNYLVGRRDLVHI